MTGFGKLWRTTAFRLSLAYLFIFMVFAAFTLGYVGWNVRKLLDEQLRSTIEAEIDGLADQYRIGSIRRLIFTVERRAREPGASLYLVTTFAGERLAGNVTALPPGTLETQGDKEVDYARGDDGEARPHRALVRVYILPGGFRLMVGRDLEERNAFRQVIRTAIFWSLLLVLTLGAIAAWFVTRRVLKRVDAMSATARSIMAGDLDERLPVGGTGDEFDRLAANLNLMLDRIGELMTGLKEVSDNIAHDLKTPLTRLRNRAEEALRAERSPDEYRAALEATIEESDTLIRLFNALLMIARLEAGQSAEAFARVDVAELVEGVSELYEPLAEEAGGRLKVDLEPGLAVTGSRELVGQAVANLVDNAIKYGMGEDADPLRRSVLISARRHGGRIEIIVADHGPGIPQDARAKAFERFARLEGARTAPGFGLGLNLVAAVARLHKGDVRLEDGAPGLRAVLSLPAA